MMPLGTPALTHVLFDVDGTLIDSRAAIVASYRHAFDAVLGVEFPQTDDEVRDLMAARLREACERVAGDRAAECEATYRAFYLETGSALVTPIPGARALLDGVVARGLAVGLVTNKGGERLAADLAHGGMEGFEWSAVVTAEDCAERKPHPMPIRLALRQAGAAPRATVYLGDGPHDLVAASASEVLGVGAAYGYYGRGSLAEHDSWAIIDAPGELLDVIDAAAGTG
jgi:phosphoglycolate phosphatase-like HAD superfamily hydrolase